VEDPARVCRVDERDALEAAQFRRRWSQRAEALEVPEMAAAIRTPDQRLRPLRELDSIRAGEGTRGGARAISALQLAPVNVRARGSTAPAAGAVSSLPGSVGHLHRPVLESVAGEDSAISIQTVTFCLISFAELALVGEIRGGPPWR
jgi:hypothetical protein